MEFEYYVIGTVISLIIVLIALFSVKWLDKKFNQFNEWIIKPSRRRSIKTQMNPMFGRDWK